MLVAFDPLAGMKHPIVPRADLASRPPTVLVFDSGLGGLTVHRELIRARPDARFVYCADDAAFPYGDLAEDHLVARVVAVLERLIGIWQPDCIVIACNTASTLVMPHLRARFAVPFIGTVPAIKPACEQSESRMVSVLATPGTVARDYTRALIAEYGGGCDVTLVGSERLASLAESAMRGDPCEEASLAAEIAPCFVQARAGRTDTVVLACTHYPLLLDTFRQLAPWPVRWIDPAPAIARRLVQILGAAPPSEAPASDNPGPGTAILTGGASLSSLSGVFSGFGFAETRVEPLPLH
jgi:glutamate racemase